MLLLDVISRALLTSTHNLFLIKKEVSNNIIFHLKNAVNSQYIAYLILGPGTVARSVIVRFASNGRAIDPPVQYIFSLKNNFPLPLIQEELVVSYWRKNGHLILVNCPQGACTGTEWLSN